MLNNFRLLMISAMYENGGNTTHRFLDGHPQMYVYPFESQLGTKFVMDHFASLFPIKYRWPEFALDGTPEQDYRAIIDEETKVRTRTPHVSKFRHMPFRMNDEERMADFASRVRLWGRSRAAGVAAFFQSTFETWKDYERSGKEQIYVGYSPVVIVDADKILNDLPEAHILHVVRNPWSAYADTKKRPVPLSPQHYMLAWNMNQYFALLYKEKYPGRVHIVRLEDVLADPVTTLGGICTKLGLESSETLAHPSWNGRELEEVYPWGTIRKATPESNMATANELSDAEKDEVRQLTWQYLEAFGYTNFFSEKPVASAR